MKPVNTQRLVDAIGVVDEELAAVEELIGERPNWHTTTWQERNEFDKREREAIEAMKGRLAASLGARFREQPGSNHYVTLAGIRSSSTSSWRGALLNWRRAALARIGEAA